MTTKIIEIWACRCGKKRNARNYCAECGLEKPGPELPAPVHVARPVCRACHAPLLASGLCSATGGYPVGMKCPFACPVCRGPLEWHGGCYACHGAMTKADPWRFPGDRYDCFDEYGQPLGGGLHWIRTAGPRDLPPGKKLSVMGVEILPF